MLAPSCSNDLSFFSDEEDAWKASDMPARCPILLGVLQLAEEPTDDAEEGIPCDSEGGTMLLSKSEDRDGSPLELSVGVTVPLTLFLRAAASSGVA